MFQTTYHTQAVNNVEVFYREAGAVDAPVLLMLHGFPSSSHQFRNVIPLLADQFRVIALETHGFEVAERIRSFLGGVTQRAE